MVRKHDALILFLEEKRQKNNERKEIEKKLVTESHDRIQDLIKESKELENKRKKRIENIIKKDVLLLKKYKNKKKKESNLIKEIPDHEKSYQQFKEQEQQRIDQQRKELILKQQQSTPNFPKSRFYSKSKIELENFKKGEPPKEVRLMNSVFKKRQKFDEERKKKFSLSLSRSQSLASSKFSVNQYFNPTRSKISGLSGKQYHARKISLGNQNLRHNHEYLQGKKHKKFEIIKTPPRTPITRSLRANSLQNHSSAYLEEQRKKRKFQPVPFFQGGKKDTLEYIKVRCDLLSDKIGRKEQLVKTYNTVEKGGVRQEELEEEIQANLMSSIKTRLKLLETLEGK